MVRFIAILAAALGLAGCEIASTTPLLEASTARAIASDYNQRIDANDAEGEYAILTAQDDGRTILIDAYETDFNGEVRLSPPSFWTRFHTLGDYPRFFIVELLLPPETTNDENRPLRGYGLVTCNQENVLVFLDMDIPQDQKSSANDDRVVDEWGTLTISSDEVLFDVLNAVLDGNHYAPIEGNEFEDTISCAALFADPI